MNWRQKRQLKQASVVLVGGIIAFFLLILLIRQLQDVPEEFVEQFYKYESEAVFSKSWEMLHSEMKTKFPSKASYVQDRSHVFLQHMGVATFSYSIGKAEKKKEWQMAKDSEVFVEVYEVPVTLHFNSKYGRFQLEQNCYVLEEEGEWYMLWDYQF